MTLPFDTASPECFRETVARCFGLLFDDAKLGFLGDVLRRRADARGTAAEDYVLQLEAGVTKSSGACDERFDPL